VIIYTENQTLPPIAARVLDRALVELALLGGVLGDVGQPQLVRRLRAEVAGDEIVVDRRAGPAGLPALVGMD
jgi:hypothetical protein